MKKNMLLTISYDGSGFHGWQRQPDKRTVQGELEKTLSHTLGRKITVDGTSRTDSGVHALGQRASFLFDIDIPTQKLPMILNNSLSKGRIFGERLPGEIKIIDAEEMPLDFHARFNAVGKKYAYRISTGPNQDIFKRNYFYQLTRSLDIEKMKEAAEYLIGTHDFKSFEASGGTERESTTRTINSLDIISESKNSEFTIEVIGDGFLYNMVRIIVGTLVEVGLARRSPDEIKDIIESKDRRSAGHTAPPAGLYLVEVYYNEANLKKQGAVE